MKGRFRPKISIVIPIYNGLNYMREAIDSALAQTYKNIEVIVVNDGSIDDTETIAKSYGDKVRYFAKENGGVSSALNLALREMKGEYFSWLSHDDVYYPEKIQKQMKYLSSLENKDVILYSDYEFMNEKSDVVRTMILDHEMLAKKPEYALLRSSINGNTLLISKKAFNEYGKFDEGLKCTQDYDMWSRMMKTYKFVHVPEILAKYRIHQMQDTNKNPNFAIEGDILWIKMIRELPIETKKKLEGSEFNFYREMSEYLKNTPFEDALKVTNKKIREIILKQKRKCSAVVSFISHSADNSGAERALLDIIDAVKEQGVFVHVILPRKGKLEQELIDRNVFYEIMDLPWWANVDKVNIQNVQKSIRESALILALKLRLIEPNIIFTSTTVINEGALAARMLGISHIWNISEFGKKEHGVDYMLDEKERIGFINDYSDKIFFVSNALKDYYKGKVDESKMVVVPNLVRIIEKVEKRKFFQLKNAFKLVILGNIIKGKGQKDAILAVVELLKRNKQVELIIAGTAGDKEYYNELQQIVRSAKLQDNIKFIGYVDNSASLISQADAVLVCSINEGFGRVTVEGMLLKKPIIGANSGATPELIRDNVNGFLYRPGNYEELSQKIEYFIEHQEDIKRMGQCGFDFIKKSFNKEKYLENLLKEFLELKNNKKESILPGEIIEEIVNNIELKKKEIKEKDAIINDMKQEIALMEASKFWKLRNSYMALKNTIRSSQKNKKYGK